jgi:hypothetical protein
MAMRRIMFVCLLLAGVGMAPADEPAKQPAAKTYTTAFARSMPDTRDANAKGHRP